MPGALPLEATARRVVEVHAAVAEMQVDRRLHGVVDGARHLPVAVGANAKAADIAIGGQTEPVVAIVMVALADQRIDPSGLASGTRSRKDPRVQGQVRGEGPGAKADA